VRFAGDKQTLSCYLFSIKQTMENDIMTTSQKRDDQFVRLPKDLFDQLAEIAKLEDRSVAGTVRHIVREGIARRTTEQDVRGAAR
jgi:Arc-like DNA binding domain